MAAPDEVSCWCFPWRRARTSGTPAGSGPGRSDTAVEKLGPVDKANASAAATVAGGSSSTSTHSATTVEAPPPATAAAAAAPRMGSALQVDWPDLDRRASSGEGAARSSRVPARAPTTSAPTAFTSDAPKTVTFQQPSPFHTAEAPASGSRAQVDAPAPAPSPPAPQPPLASDPHDPLSLPPPRVSRMGKLPSLGKAHSQRAAAASEDGTWGAGLPPLRQPLGAGGRQLSEDGRRGGRPSAAGLPAHISSLMMPASPALSLAASAAPSTAVEHLGRGDFDADSFTYTPQYGGLGGMGGGGLGHGPGTHGPGAHRLSPLHPPAGLMPVPQRRGRPALPDSPTSRGNSVTMGVIPGSLPSMTALRPPATRLASTTAAAAVATSPRARAEEQQGGPPLAGGSQPTDPYGAAAPPTASFGLHAELHAGGPGPMRYSPLGLPPQPPPAGQRPSRRGSEAADPPRTPAAGWPSQDSPALPDRPGARPPASTQAQAHAELQREGQMQKQVSHGNWQGPVDLGAAALAPRASAPQAGTWAPGEGFGGGADAMRPTTAAVASRKDAQARNEELLASLLGTKSSFDFAAVKIGGAGGTAAELERFDRVTDALSRLDAIMGAAPGPAAAAPAAGAAGALGRAGASMGRRAGGGGPVGEGCVAW